MAYDESKLVTIQTLKETVTRIKTEYTTSIAKSGHASFRKADKVPTAQEAQENTLYIVKNEETTHYDIYALIDDEVVRLDDTDVDLDGYVTEENLNQALSIATDAEADEMLADVFADEA